MTSRRLSRAHPRASARRWHGHWPGAASGDWSLWRARETSWNGWREELRARHGTVVTVVPADLSESNAPQRLKEETDRRGLTVDFLVNNAGFGSSGPFETLPAGREADMVTVNVAAVVGLTRAYLPEIVARGRGGVLNVASTAGFQPTPYMTTYGATKAFLVSFTEALWAEMRDQGRRNVRVSCLCPGATATEFGANAGRDRGRFDSLPSASSAEVAEAGLDGWEQNRPIVIAGRANAVGAFMTRFVPRTAVARMSATPAAPARCPHAAHLESASRHRPRPAGRCVGVSDGEERLEGGLCLLLQRIQPLHDPNLFYKQEA